MVGGGGGGGLFCFVFLQNVHLYEFLMDHWNLAADF